MSRRGTTMCAVVVTGLSLLLGLLGFAAPASAAAATGGKITGEVTDSSGHNLGVGVAWAYRDGSTTPVAGAWIRLGDYSLSVPDDGDYKVYFSEYLSVYTIPEYYDDKRSLAEANTVSVRGGATASGIDAQLVSGGRISGRVRATNWNGIKDAIVAAYDADTGAFRTSTTTDADGGYTLPVLDPGAYKLYFAGPSGGRYISEYYDNEPSLAAADPVTVSAGRTTSVHDAYLSSGGTISGRVTDDASRPIEGALIGAYTSQGFVTSAATGADGRYTLPPVPEGDYTIGFFGPSGSDYAPEYYDDEPTAATADPVRVRGATTSGIDAVLSPATGLTGRVTDGSGTGLHRATVFAYRADTGAAVGGVFTQADGSYTLRLSPGQYKVAFAGPEGSGLRLEYYDDKPTKAAADPVTVTSSPKVVNASLDAPGRISGFVRSDGGPRIAGATVTAYTPAGTSVASATSAANGTYTIDGLAAGQYKVGFTGPAGRRYAPEFHDDEPTLERADPVAVNAGRTTTVAASLTEPAAFSGRVTSLSSRQAIPRAVVTALTAGGDQVATATADDQGTYTLENLTPGNYKLRFAGPTGSDYITEYHHDKSTLATAKVLRAYSGRTITVSEQLASAPPPGRISGFVRGDSGRRVVGATVTAYTVDGKPAASATTTGGGVYAIDGLAAGSYKVGFAGPTDGVYVPEYHKDKATLAQADAVKVLAGRTTSISASLSEPGTFSGRVTSLSTREPIAAAVVTAYTADGTEVAGATTNGQGIYTLDGLTPGNYKLRFAGPAGSDYITEYHHDKSTLATAKVLRAHPGRTITVSEQLDSPPPPGRISGSVRADNGRRISGATVTAYSLSGQPAGSATTAANGTFSIGDLPTGSYKVGFDGGSDYIAEYHLDKPTLAKATTVTVRSRGTTVLTGMLAPKRVPGAISGVVLNTRHQRLKGVTVTAYDATGASRGTAVTAANGTYSIAGLDPGSYRIGFAAPAGYVSQFFTGATALTQARSITVRNGRTTTAVNIGLLTVEQAARQSATA